jgi:hypothetical protein
MTITLFVGDNDNALAEAAQKINPMAWLIDHNNYKNFLLTKYNKDITVYTSFSDLPKITSTNAVFFEVLKKADVIFYCPPLKWSDHSDVFVWENNRTITEYFLYHINLVKNNVQGLDLKSYQNSGYLVKTESRKTVDKQLWIAGCSIAHGIGVDNNKKFGALISDKLDLEVSHLTEAGSSIEWAADQILRSDIRKHDIVIWGLTQEVRAPMAVNGKVRRETDPGILLNETSLYRAVTGVHQVVNFCKKISARLLLLPIICSEQLQLQIHSLNEYHQLLYYTQFLDLGTDNIHPGPLQHAAWADICVKLLKDSNR